VIPTGENNHLRINNNIYRACSVKHWIVCKTQFDTVLLENQLKEKLWSRYEFKLSQTTKFRLYKFIFEIFTNCFNLKPYYKMRLKL